jgi:predicted RNase H-like HicB family nuclease
VENIMLTYKSSYKTTDGTILGAVLDFPGTIAYGGTMDEARENLASALRDMAETNLLGGEALPIPDPNLTDPDAELEEPIHLILQAGQQLSMSVGTTAR